MPVSRLRKPLELTLAPASSRWLARTAARQGTSRSRVVDKLVAEAIEGERKVREERLHAAAAAREEGADDGE